VDRNIQVSRTISGEALRSGLDPDDETGTYTAEILGFPVASRKVIWKGLREPRKRGSGGCVPKPQRTWGKGYPNHRTHATSGRIALRLPRGSTAASDGRT